MEETSKPVLIMFTHGWDFKDIKRFQKISKEVLRIIMGLATGVSTQPRLMRVQAVILEL